MTQKAWWKSKTLWVNALVLLLTTLAEQTSLLREVLPVNLYAIVAIALPVVNMVLRVATTMPLARKDSEFIR